MADYPHPELEATTPVLVAQAAHRRLAADEPLQAFARGGIDEGDVEELLLDQTTTEPRILTLVEAYDEERDGSSHQARLSTLLRHLVVMPVDPALDLRGHLKTRVIERIKRALLQPNAFDPGGAGVLLTDDDPPRPITDYLERFQRVAAPTWRSDLNLTITTVQSLWVSTIDILTRTYQ